MKRFLLNLSSLCLFAGAAGVALVYVIPELKRRGAFDAFASKPSTSEPDTKRPEKRVRRSSRAPRSSGVRVGTSPRPEQTRQLPTAVAREARASVSAYRSNRIDPRARSVPAEIQKGVFHRPRTYLGPLVETLTQGIDDDLRKVKILHDWIADNIAYDVPALLSGDLQDPAYEVTLRSRKAVCEGTAVLLKEMCDRARIPCEEVIGYARGATFGIDEREDLKDFNHAWNAVKVGGQWHLIDATWDAGHADGTRFNKRFSTNYLYLAPEHFVNTHYPKDPRWQLLDEPLSRSDFASQPVLNARFFTLGCETITPLTKVNRAAKTALFDIRAPRDTAVTARLEALDEREIPNRVLIQRNGTTVRVNIAFPRAGTYRLQIFGKRASDPGPYRNMALIGIQASGGSDRGFPRTYLSYNRRGASLYGPLFSPLKANARYPFRIRVEGVAGVFLAVDRKRWVPFQRSSSADTYELVADIREFSTVKIVARPDASQNDAEVLVEYGR